MKNKPTLFWHYDTAAELAIAYDKLKAAGFTVSRPKNSGWKILVIGMKGQTDLFEQVQKVLGAKM